jgi:hypothetical protein
MDGMCCVVYQYQVIHTRWRQNESAADANLQNKEKNKFESRLRIRRSSGRSRLLSMCASPHACHRGETPVAATHTPDRESFMAYLERSGMLDTLTNRELDAAQCIHVLTRA